MTNLSLGPVLQRTFSDPHISFQVVLNKPVYNCGKQKARYLCIPSTHLWKHQLRKVLNDDFQTFPAGSAVKNLPANIGDAASVPWLGRSPGEGNPNALQHSCLADPMDRGARWATVHGFRERLDTT